MTVGNAACPECGRPWLYALTFQHAAARWLYQADAATAAADKDRGRGERRATETELRFIVDGLGAAPAVEHWQYLVKFEHIAGIHHRAYRLAPTDPNPTGGSS